MEMSPLRLSAVEPPVDMTWFSEGVLLPIHYQSCRAKRWEQREGQAGRGNAACSTSTLGVRQRSRDLSLGTLGMIGDADSVGGVRDAGTAWTRAG